MKRQKANSLENITWSELGKQNIQAIKVYYGVTCDQVVLFVSNSVFWWRNDHSIWHYGTRNRTVLSLYGSLLFPQTNYQYSNTSNLDYKFLWRKWNKSYAWFNVNWNKNNISTKNDHWNDKSPRFWTFRFSATWEWTWSDNFMLRLYIKLESTVL